MVLFLPLPETLLLVGLIHWFGDVWKILLFKKGIHKQLLLFFGIPGVIASTIGATLILNIPEKIASQIVGIIIIFYLILLIFNHNLRIKESPQNALLGGASSGFLAGVSGVGGGALRAIVLTAFDIPKSTYIFTAGVLGALIDIARIITYYAGGIRINNNILLGFLFFILASFIGAEIAKRIVDKIPQKSFRRVVAFFLFLVGVKLLIFPS